jgi:Hypervirulence associated proteins TUDOR domain
MPDKLKKGDKVTWGTSQGEAYGTVEKIVTTTTKVKGHTAKATREHPEVMVKSGKSGKEAIHKPEALKKS